MTQIKTMNNTKKQIKYPLEHVEFIKENATIITFPEGQKLYSLNLRLSDVDIDNGIFQILTAPDENIMRMLLNRIKVMRAAQELWHKDKNIETYSKMSREERYIDTLVRDLERYK